MESFVRHHPKVYLTCPIVPMSDTQVVACILLKLINCQRCLKDQIWVYNHLCSLDQVWHKYILPHQKKRTYLLLRMTSLWQHWIRLWLGAGWHWNQCLIILSRAVWLLPKGENAYESDLYNTFETTFVKLKPHPPGDDELILSVNHFTPVALLLCHGL